MDAATLYTIVTLATGEDRLVSTRSFAAVEQCERFQNLLKGRSIRGLPTRYECHRVFRSDLLIPSRGQALIAR